MRVRTVLLCWILFLHSPVLLTGGKKPVENHAAVWVPDNEATICMHCNKTQFTVLNRRVITKAF